MMRIPYGQSCDVYRFPQGRDQFGDAEPVKVGTIEHVVVAQASSQSSGLRFISEIDAQETSNNTAVVYAPRDAAVKLQARDRLSIDGQWWQVVGNRAYDTVHPMTGTDFGYYMMQVTVTV